MGSILVGDQALKPYLRRWAVIFGLLGGLFPTFPAAHAVDVTIYTEHYPPYNYADDDGNVVGSATDIVRRVMDETGLSYELKLVPWNRAYTLATKMDDVFVYSLAHMPDRQDQFHWLVPIHETELYLYGRAEDAAAFTPERLKSGDIRGACVIGDNSCMRLRHLGIPASAIIEGSDMLRSEGRLLDHGRADVFIAQEGYEALYAPEGAQNRYVKLMTLPDPCRFYLAAGKQVRPELVQAVKEAYERITTEGRVVASSFAD